MSSSWFLVLIPTKEHEARLQNLNIVEPIDEPVINKSKLPNGTTQNDGKSPSSGTGENTENGVNSNTDPAVKHENTEKSAESFYDSELSPNNFFHPRNHHPPINVAQKDLNKPNEDLTLECTYFELDLQEAFQVLNVSQATYQLTKNGNFYLVSFCIEASNVEAALICLQNYGIGNTEFTSISVVPTNIHIDCPEQHPTEDLIQG